MGLDLEALKKKYDPEHGWASARDEECREVLALIEELAEARRTVVFEQNKYDRALHDWSAALAALEGVKP